MARKDEATQNKYDSLLLNIVQSTDNKVGNLTTEVVKQGVELKNNTFETAELKKQTALVKREVRETNGSVLGLKQEVVKIKKVVFPEGPVKKASELDVWYRDAKIIKLLSIAGGIILTLLTIYAGLNRIPVPGV